MLKKQRIFFEQMKFDCLMDAYRFINKLHKVNKKFTDKDKVLALVPQNSNKTNQQSR